MSRRHGPAKPRYKIRINNKTGCPKIELQKLSYIKGCIKKQ